MNLGKYEQVYKWGHSWGINVNLISNKETTWHTSKEEVTLYSHEEWRLKNFKAACMVNFQDTRWSCCIYYWFLCFASKSLSAHIYLIKEKGDREENWTPSVNCEFWLYFITLKFFARNLLTNCCGLLRQYYKKLVHLFVKCHIYLC